MKKKLGLPFILIFLITILFSDLTHAETPLREKFIVLFEENTNHTVIPETVSIEHTFSMIPAVLIETSVIEAENLKKLPGVKAVQKEQFYEVGANPEPYGFEPMQLTKEVRSLHTGNGVKIGVLDTGVDTNHPDLKITGGICVLKECPKGYQDDNGHGTHVAGIIGAQGNRQDVQGVAPGAEIYAIKAMNAFGEGTTSTIISGVEWAMKNKLDVINLSIAAEANDLLLEAILDKAYKEGMLIVAAAGNEGDKKLRNSIQYPAKYESVIAVGAIDSLLKRLPTSAEGEQLEVVAPGYQILSTFPTHIHDGGYAKMTGTSMAAPYVTGMLALYKESRPLLSNVEIRAWMENHTKDLGVSGRDSQYGYGLPLFTEFPPENDHLKGKVDLVSFSKGEAIFNVQPAAGFENYSVYRNNTLISKNVSDNSFTDYIQSGAHDYVFHFNNKNGETAKISVSVQADQPVMKDVSAVNWYAQPMIYLYKEDILRGLNNYFQPAKLLTRGEAVAMLGRALSLNENAAPTKFTDVHANYFAAGYIQSAFDQKILNGFSDGTFRPDQLVTRAEMAILLANGFKLQEQAGTSLFWDVHQNVTGKEAIHKISVAGITKGFSDGAFKPYAYMNRAEYAVFVARALNPQFIE